MRCKLVGSNYNAETGVSCVTLGCRHGNFTGYARVHPEEKENYKSSFFGCELAEKRAYIKALKALQREYKHKVAAFKEVENILKNIKDYNPATKEIRKIRKARYIYESKIKHIDIVINSVKENIKNAPEERAKHIDKLYSGKNN